MAALLVDPFPDGFFVDFEGAGDVPHQIGDQQPVTLMRRAMLRRMDMANHFAAFVGEHDDERVGNPERTRRRGFRLHYRPAALARARLLSPFCFAHLSSYRGVRPETPISASRRCGAASRSWLMPEKTIA